MKIKEKDRINHYEIIKFLVYCNLFLILIKKNFEII